MLLELNVLKIHEDMFFIDEQMLSICSENLKLLLIVIPKSLMEVFRSITLVFDEA